MKMESIAQVMDFDPMNIRTEEGATHNIGEAVRMADQRVFRYAKASAALVAGYLYCAAAPKTNHHNVAATVAAAIGAKKVTVQLGATAAVANEYAEGYFVASDNAPEGQTYKIKSHPAADSAGTLEITLFDPLKTAATTASEFCLVHNNYIDVVGSTTQTHTPAGVPMVAVTAADDYCWLQTAGICAILADETVAVGAEATIGSSVAGAVETKDSDLEKVVAMALVAGVDTEFRPMMLEIG